MIRVSIRKSWFFALFLTFASAAWAGGGTSAGAPAAPAPDFFGMDCASWKGKVLVVDGTAFCRIGSAIVLESTMRLDEKRKTPSTAAMSFLGHGESGAGTSRDPAYSYCRMIGGMVVLYQNMDPSKPVRKIRTCLFADQSEIELKTLFDGPEKHPKLTRILRELN